MSATRDALHAIAEQLLAGPQYRASKTIRLRVSAAGFATVAEPALRMDGVELVTADDRIDLRGASIASAADRAGIDAGAPEGSYEPSTVVGADDELQLDVVTVAKLAEALAIGDAALRAFAPDEVPVLWPEHLDVAIRTGDVNYGVSPGDGFLDEPYAYVGPDTVPAGDFWNAPFGAARPLAEMSDAAAVAAFFAEGRDEQESGATA